MKKIFLIISLFLFSCTDEKIPENDGSDYSDIFKISGSVVLPVGSSIDLGALTVSSVFDNSQITNSKYSVAVENKFETQYVTKQDGAVVLMGYTYPGQVDNSISVESTALALLMTFPTFSDLSEEGKLLYINKVKGDSNFTKLKDAISEKVKTGKDLFDENDSTLAMALLNVIESGVKNSKSKMEGGSLIANESTTRSMLTSSQEPPVNFYRNGRDITLVNPGNVFTTVVGVYKDNTRVQEIVMKGLTIYPKSISEVYDGKNILQGLVPKEEKTKLTGDGEFILKFRTGNPLGSDGSPEHNKAMLLTLRDYALKILTNILPALTEKCMADVTTTISSRISAYLDINKDLNAGNALLKTAEIAYELVSMGFNCYGKAVGKKWVESTVKYVKWANATFTSIEVGVLGVQWSKKNSVVDICLKAEGREVNDCEDDKPEEPGDTAFYIVGTYANVNNNKQVYTFKKDGEGILYYDYRSIFRTETPFKYEIINDRGKTVIRFSYYNGVNFWENFEKTGDGIYIDNRFYKETDPVLSGIYLNKNVEEGLRRVYQFRPDGTVESDFTNFHFNLRYIHPHTYEIKKVNNELICYFYNECNVMELNNVGEAIGCKTTFNSERKIQIFDDSLIIGNRIYVKSF